MKKIFAVIMGVAAFIFLTTSAEIAHAATSTISTCAELEAIDTNATSTFMLVNDIDCSGSVFVPIANFHGILDGDGFTINNVTRNLYTNYSGIFSFSDGATFKNLKITNASIWGNFEIGILVADAANTTFSNVFVQGAIRSGASLSLMGGLAGKISSSTIVNSRAAVTSDIGYSIVGGLVGQIANTSTVSSSFATGLITVASASGNSNLGGLVGINTNSTIRNSYANVNLFGYGNNIGGLVGLNELGSLIDTSYSVGPVSSTASNKGGLVGLSTDTATTTNSYWDTQASGRATSAGGTGTSTSQMQTQSTYSGWNFVNAWSLATSSYPTLLNFDTVSPTAPGVPTSTSAASSTLPTVTWSASTDAGGLPSRPYLIQWSTSSNFSGTVYSSTTATSSFAPTAALTSATWYFRVQTHDLAGNTSIFVTSSAVTVDVDLPVITLLGSPTIDITIGETYSDAGASAADAIDGNLTSSIITTSTINMQAAGTYTLTYTVSDAAGNSATPVTRTIIVRASPTVGVAAGGGGFTVGTSVSSNTPTFTIFSFAVTTTTSPSLVSSVTAMTSTPLTTVLEHTPLITTSASVSPRYAFSRNLRQGMHGNDVRELQKFLNTHGFVIAKNGSGSPGQETDYFGPSTAVAITRFQESNAGQILTPLRLTKGTGNFMESTRRFLLANF